MLIGNQSIKEMMAILQKNGNNKIIYDGDKSYRI